jgi:amino acid transporter
MSEEIRDAQRTLPRAVLGSGILIAAMYMVGTIAVMSLVTPADVSPTSGVFHAVTVGSTVLGVAFIGIIAAVLVSFGNAGGVGSTVAGIARVPFIVGIDRYLPQAFGKIHPKWRTPYISILVQAVASALVLLVSQINETTRGAYQVLIDITIIIYFIPFLYMFAAIIKLAKRADRTQNKRAVLIPGGKLGVWLIAGLGFVVVVACMLVSAVPPGDSSNRFLFEVKLLAGSVGGILLGLILYWRGAGAKSGRRP